MKKLSASIMCANLLRLENDLRALQEGGIHELHFDIMDGAFVPNLTLGFDIIRAAKSCVDIPRNAHLMMYKPETSSASSPPAATALPSTPRPAPMRTASSARFATRALRPASQSIPPPP